MNLAFLAAVGIAVSYGLATVLQSVGARRETAKDGFDPGLLVRLLRSVPYMIGLGLDGLGFVLTVLALQSLPLFVVEAFTAAALAVTAVAAAAWLKVPLSRGEWMGVAAVVAGLLLLALSAAEGETVELTEVEHWMPLLIGLVLVVLTWAASRMTGRLSVVALGTIAGLGFGLVGIATSAIAEPISVLGLLTDPAAWAIVVAGGVSMLALATALQRGAVTQATAAMVVAETVIPSIIGLLFLGNRIRPGYEAAMVVGMVLAVGGAVLLARMGELPEEQVDEAREGAPA